MFLEILLSEKCYMKLALSIYQLPFHIQRHGLSPQTPINRRVLYLEGMLLAMDLDPLLPPMQ